MIEISLSLSAFEYDLLKTILEEEIDRNCNDYPEINRACRNIIKQVRKNEGK